MSNSIMPSVRKSLSVSLLAAAIALSLPGCSVGPTYERPDASAPAAFKESEPSLESVQAKSWKVAQPSDHFERGHWWLVFGDPQLNDLELKALESNQNLVAAYARLKQARALTAAARSELFPKITLNGEASRERESPASKEVSSDSSIAPKTLLGLKSEISYEPDLFGRVQAGIDGSKARTEASEALLRGVQLSLTADVAASYFKLRGLDAEMEVFQRAIEIRERAVGIADARHTNGDVSVLDVARARSELATTQSDALAVAKDRATEEHRLAILLGKAPAEFSLPSSPLVMTPVRIPTGMPSMLLERRPDIAAAERKMAAANADIGVAKAAFFPSIKLGLTGGFEASHPNEIFNWSSRTFLLGPVGGTILSLPIFDGGQRSAKLKHERWAYEEQVAAYRQAVLQAFQEVEDVASDLRIVDQQLERMNIAVDASIKASEVANLQYAEGEVPYLDALDAERVVLQSRRSKAQLEATQAIATVKLIQALGGGWEATSLSATEPATSAH